MEQNTNEKTHFLNVDLDLYSKSDLQPLVTAMGEKVCVLWIGRHKRTYRAHLELASHSRNPDSTISGFCTLIRTLPRAARKVWDAAKLRDFNIGVQAAMQPNGYSIALAAETVRAACDVNARIVITVYSSELLREGTSDVAPSSRKATRTSPGS